ncbi:hypothetical protein NFJ02_31g79310 [Pycnococcus provasolii]
MARPGTRRPGRRGPGRWGYAVGRTIYISTWPTAIDSGAQAGEKAPKGVVGASEAEAQAKERRQGRVSAAERQVRLEEAKTEAFTSIARLMVENARQRERRESAQLERERELQREREHRRELLHSTAHALGVPTDTTPALQEVHALRAQIEDLKTMLSLRTTVQRDEGPTVVEPAQPQHHPTYSVSKKSRGLGTPRRGLGRPREASKASARPPEASLFRGVPRPPEASPRGADHLP